MKRKVILVILDGWGISAETNGNAIANASTPSMDSFYKFYPHTLLEASGIAAGLPWGEMGNSEVGHMIMGAGKILYQKLPRVSRAIQNKSFFENIVLLNSVKHAKQNDSNIHIMGLLSDGGVHSHIDHLFAILEFLKMQEIDKNRVFIHIITDGRDADPKSGVKFVSALEKNMKEENWPGKIASIMGRYYAMDRNQNWERTAMSYNCMVNAVGEKQSDAIIALQESYKRDITDEFIKPTMILDENNDYNLVKENDSVIFFNIREDRARQITKAFVQEKLSEFDRGGKLANLNFSTMIKYENNLDANVIFTAENVQYPLGRVISDAGLKQLRIAETEKYAHVTYFFNGGKEEPFKNEYRTLVPSPLVAKYDAVPEMSADLITDQVIEEIKHNQFDFILVNFANADLVGHTGNYKATIDAIEFIDKCLARIYDTVIDSNATLIITADHGNAEEMINVRNGKKVTEHSTNPVPFILINSSNKFDEENVQSIDKKSGGILSDVAPTIIEILNLEQPEQMTGQSLLENF